MSHAEGNSDDAPPPPPPSQPSQPPHPPRTNEQSPPPNTANAPQPHPSFLHTPYDTSAGANDAAHASNAAALLSAGQPSSIYPTFHIRKPSTAGLHLQTESNAHGDPDATPTQGTAHDAAAGAQRDSLDESGDRRRSVSRGRPQPIDYATERLASAHTRSPPSSVSSPMLSALRDVTPLPSPIGGSPPDLWRRVARSRGNSAASIARDEAAGLLPPSVITSPPRRKKQYNLMGQASRDGLPLRAEEEAAHTRNRSLSEFVPETLHNIRPRNITTPGGAGPADAELHAASASTALGSTALGPPAASLSEPNPLHREQNFTHRNKPAAATATATASTAHAALPTPPESSRGVAEQEEADSFCRSIGTLTIKVGSRPRLWRPLRKLGEGAFSHVVLAAGEHISTEHDGELEIPPLVAIKIVKHSADGAQSKDRMDTSIRREIEMLEQVQHPNLPHLMGFDDSSEQALVVLNYCAGGDLFELASQRRQVLTPWMIQRIFSELVDAVAYLHGLYIVHRDIKLENVLCNIPAEELVQLDDPRSIPQAVVTLTDLGLSRQIPQPPESPLLTHPCGSPDYAAPEILLGQAYDGRATDAWALGVLLYAMMEGRLPFDALPGKRNTGNVKHRIARCDWLWCEHGDRFGEWIPGASGELEGAREIVEGLLQKRGRWPLAQVQQHAFCAGGTAVSGRLKRSYTAQF